ncbi:Ribonucleoside-diphosphate reductase subunit beta [Quillaja saponaria]|uniref:Ribonucleoside-diphosphate reductase subunit beta n=1 Tax=Quillaja saponaria TaxID=32244 RepID=A0AAD7LDB9_QUISA|nr:Ribonucleoside-diphosphate reductase subunit beta [Quillaja saponaria]
MSNSETLEDQRPTDQNNNDDLSEEWEIMARAWLCSFPEAKEVSMAEVEAWIDSNLSSLPEGLQSMPRSELCQRLISIQNLMRLPNKEKEVNQLDLPHARFQRTDQWIPVYSWLESLDKDEVVKSKEISDWLTENPKVQEQLCSRHSRYHLMHYIKKCHLKILKRKERKKGGEHPEKDTSLKVLKDVVMKKSAPLPCSVPSNLAKDSDLFLAKRKEAYQKYEILVELNKLLSPMFSKHPNVK